MGVIKSLIQLLYLADHKLHIKMLLDNFQSHLDFSVQNQKPKEQIQQTKENLYWKNPILKLISQLTIPIWHQKVKLTF